jgi:TRAP-type C4-dicarboxylate transport system permease small subunit
VASDISNPSGGKPAPDEPRAAAVVRRIDDFLGAVETAIAISIVTGLILVAVGQVVADKAFGLHPTWPDEVIRNFVFFVAMSGAVLAAQRKGMFNMDLVTRYFRPRVRSVLRIGAALLIAQMCGLVVRTGIAQRADTLKVTQTHEVISPATAYLALIIGFSLIALHFLLHAAAEIIHLAAGKVPPDPPHGGH